MFRQKQRVPLVARGLRKHRNIKPGNTLGLKDRYAMLSPVLLERLRVWWRVARAQGKMLDGGWLFPGLDPLQALEHPPTQPRHPRRSYHGQDRQARVHAYLEPQFRHPPAGTEGGHSRDSGFTGAPATGHHGALRSGRHRRPARSDQPAGDLAAFIGHHPWGQVPWRLRTYSAPMGQPFGLLKART
jgi:hypothetical protein